MLDHEGEKLLPSIKRNVLPNPDPKLQGLRGFLPSRIILLRNECTRTSKGGEKEKLGLDRTQRKSSPLRDDRTIIWGRDVRPLGGSSRHVLYDWFRPLPFVSKKARLHAFARESTRPPERSERQ